MSDVDSRVRRVTWALLGVALGGLIGSLLLGVVIVAQVRAAQVDRLPKSEQADETLALIKDCTQPEGQCFKDAQKRTAKAVGDINVVIIAAAACAAGVDPDMPVAQRLAVITECVTERLTP